ncbi:nuclear transport factor 2 family protein [Streptomyces sp. FXJ1.4098]|nr:nuclear transport factor 2 family protein [Streptomyces sp. FXJ1.4098]
MNALNIVDAYFAAWRADAPDQLEPLLAEDISVKGPLGRIEGRRSTGRHSRGCSGSPVIW